MIQKHSDDRGISPIIAAILLIALVVMLTAAISQFSFELSEILEEPVQAGINVDETYNVNTDDYDVRIVWATQGTVDSIYAIEPDGSRTQDLNSVGDEVDITGVEEGERVRVMGVTSEGNEGIIQEYQVG